MSQGPRRASALPTYYRKESHRSAWAVIPRVHARDPGSYSMRTATRCGSNDGWASPRSTSSTSVWDGSNCLAESTSISVASVSQPIVINESSADSESAISLQYHRECHCHLYYWLKRELTRHSMLNSVCSPEPLRQESDSLPSSLIVQIPELFRAGINLTVGEVF